MPYYTWSGNRCVRSHELDPKEKHPCYFCGHAESIATAKYCVLCGFYRCPVCNSCFCSRSAEVRAALRYLRDKYCCTPKFFELGFHDKDVEYLELVPHFIDSLDYCRKQRGIDDEDQ